MGLEAVYFLGALVLLAALIYGTLSYHYRSRAVPGTGAEATTLRVMRWARHGGIDNGQ